MLPKGGDESNSLADRCDSYSKLQDTYIVIVNSTIKKFDEEYSIILG